LRHRPALVSHSRPPCTPSSTIAPSANCAGAAAGGLLENDLLIERFFSTHGTAITTTQAEGLQVLMELPDNDLLDLLLRAHRTGRQSATRARWKCWRCCASRNEFLLITIHDYFEE
jgi:hypothetical protein